MEGKIDEILPVSVSGYHDLWFFLFFFVLFFGGRGGGFFIFEIEICLGMPFGHVILFHHATRTFSAQQSL